LALRTVEGTRWSTGLLERYMGWHNRVMAAGGGVTYAEYLVSLRRDILNHLTDAQRQAIAPLLNVPPPESPLEVLKQREFVRDWAVADLLPHAAAGLTNRNYESGRSTYALAMCAKCHRFRGEGGLTGPDLTGVGGRFDLRTLLESILEPSNMISDQYAAIQITTRDGEEHAGRIGDHTETEVLLKFDLFNPANLLRIPYADIVSIGPSAVSLMPTNLLDYFTREEILDLLAFLLSQGNRESGMFGRDPPD
jgi:putative heme-binding domain-containing protein